MSASRRYLSKCTAVLFIITIVFVDVILLLEKKSRTTFSLFYLKLCTQILQHNMSYINVCVCVCVCVCERQN